MHVATPSDDEANVSTQIVGNLARRRKKNPCRDSMTLQESARVFDEGVHAVKGIHAIAEAYQRNGFATPTRRPH
jgi:hypothetical protein